MSEPGAEIIPYEQRLAAAIQHLGLDPIVGEAEFDDTYTEQEYNGIRFSGASVKGTSYKINHDAFGIAYDPNSQSVGVIVCDGMGENSISARMAKVSSETFVDTFPKDQSLPRLLDVCRDEAIKDVTAMDPNNVLRSDLAGTTALATLIQFDPHSQDALVHVANKGDSLALIYSPEDQPPISLLNVFDNHFIHEIHQLLANKINGDVTREDVLQDILSLQRALLNSFTLDEFADCEFFQRHDEYSQLAASIWTTRNIVIKSLSIPDASVPGTYKTRLRKGQMQLNLSDGISDNLRLSEVNHILQVATENRLYDKDIIQLLIRAAQKRALHKLSRNFGADSQQSIDDKLPKPDDMTVVLIRYAA